MPNLENLKAAIGMFGKLDAAARRKAMNGWHVPPFMLHPGIVRDTGEALKICLHFTFGAHHRGREKIIAGLELMASGPSESVEVFIHAGATKMEAVNGLRARADMLERHWEETIQQTGEAEERDHDYMTGRQNSSPAA